MFLFPGLKYAVIIFYFPWEKCGIQYHMLVEVCKLEGRIISHVSYAISVLPSSSPQYKIIMCYILSQTMLGTFQI
eukprot:c34640_g1_i1 orf=67-291(+)